MSKSASLETRLFRKRRIDPITGCWRWLGAKAGCGYGYMTFNSKNEYVHRIAYEHWKGPIIEQVLHILECPYKDCFNPDHLKEGNDRLNALDRQLKGGFENTNSLKTHCPLGHEYSKENTGITNIKGGRKARYCKECKRIKAGGVEREETRDQRKLRKEQEKEKAWLEIHQNDAKVASTTK